MTLQPKQANRTVTTIPATLRQFTAIPLSDTYLRRVAAYARVSTDLEEQQNSYVAQIDYYTRYINARDDWTFVEVYTDEGITGTSTKHRDGFKRMIADALAGKIDLIVTKSVSRFARNTVDTLTTIRQLKERGVEVYFEKENIWTLDSKGELFITIMSSLAQEESRSISENCTWGQRKRFSDGKVSVSFSRFLGYDRGPDGNLVINQREAAIVRRIYGLFLRGKSYKGIAKILTQEGVPTPAGKTTWTGVVIKSILTNEKYKGDALLQKTYTVDFLTKQKRPNTGEVPQYYVHGNHEAIIPPEIFDLVQREIERRETNGRVSGLHLFSGMVRCAQCNGWYGSKTWHSNSKYYRRVWHCNRKYHDPYRCKTPHLTDQELQQHFLSALNQLIADKQQVLGTLNGMLMEVLNTDTLEQERDRLSEEAAQLVTAVEDGITQNARIALDQVAYSAEYTELALRYDAIKAQLDDVMARLDDLRKRQAEIRAFMNTLTAKDGLYSGFDEEAWYALTEYMTVQVDGRVLVKFKNGQEVWSAYQVK